MSSWERIQLPKWYEQDAKHGVPPDKLADIPTISDRTKAWLEQPHQDRRSQQPPVHVDRDVQEAIARVRAAKMAIIRTWRVPRGVRAYGDADTGAAL